MEDALNRWVDLGNRGEALLEAMTADVQSLERLIAYISRFFTLKTGDILYTGAPQGSHEACIDDHLEGFLDHRKVLDMRCK